ncbi:MAG: hypothetical protein PHV36_13730 [Elusimicrobiales bacterium]|nr:hypothetical protein [Elusimicrobiales bacterium]
MQNKKNKEKTIEPGFGSSDINKTLAEVIRSRDQQNWETFPAMLMNAAEAGEFNYREAAAYLDGAGQNDLKLLIFASLGLFESLGLKFKWTKDLFSDFPARLVNHYRDQIKANSELAIAEISLQPGNLRENLLKRPKQPSKPVKQAAEAAEQLDLEIAVSRIFTQRQKELFLKKLRRKKMTKTEKEYFSRVIKKKVQALANEDLHNLARKILE